MMEDLAMQILELMMNSIQANAKHILLHIRSSTRDNVIAILQQDDGKGMDRELLERVTNPFATTRTTRKVGMGVAFMKGLTEACNGSFHIESTPGKGTSIRAEVQRDCIDTPPLGDIGEMMMECIQASESIDYEMVYETDSSKFVFQSSEIRQQLEGVSLQEPQVLLWIKEYINQNIEGMKEDMK